MSLKSLAEGIILQSIEDLWNENHRNDCITFFTSRDLRLCAELAGMDINDQVELLNMVKKSMRSIRRNGKKNAVREKGSARERENRARQREKVLKYA
jgi:hypothetical protein